ncbi:MAG: S-layer homology domain-containing protein [Clostridia bacterium]|nr:S-layer homology domain-containing protein [Clostridia bacterium]
MKIKRLSAILCALLTSVSLTGLPAHAADPAPVEIDGVMTSFVTSFGKISYNKGSYPAFKTLDDGLSSLSQTGGKVVFTGTTTFSGDTIGCGDSLAFQGQGTKTTGNVIKTSEALIHAASDLAFDNLSYNVPEGAVLNMHGNNFTASSAVNAFFTSNYSTGLDTYTPSLSVVSGDASEEYSFVIGSGNYATVALASGNVSADSVHTVSGGEFEKLVVGSYDGACDADIVLNITDGNIGELVIGADSGKMNGKITVNVNGGTIGKISAGAYGTDAEFSGSATVMINGTDIGEIAASGDGKTDAFVAYICLSEDEFAVSENAKFNNMLALSGGTGVPEYNEAGVLTGIVCYDEYGCPAVKLVSDTAELLPQNGVFTVPEGKFTGKIVSGIELGLNSEAKFVAGYADGTFLPAGNMTRAEAITALTRIIVADENAVKNCVAPNNFTDVADDAWYSGYIRFFDKTGLLTKISDGDKIYPDRPITRAEFVQLIYNVERKLEKLDAGVDYADFSKLIHNISAVIANADKYDEFSDVDYTNLYSIAVYDGIANGYVTGYEDGTFRPDGSITRAEVVTVINRVLGRIPAGDVPATFTDVADHWAKAQINAAITERGAGWSAPSGNAADGTAAADYITAHMNNKKASDLAKMMVTHLYKSACDVIAATDIPADAKTAVKTAINSLRDEQRNKNTTDIVGTKDDPRNHIYSYMGGPYVREVVIKSKKPGTEPVNIVQTTDTHFNLVNDLDEKEKNPSIMSTKIGRLWLANGSSVTPVGKAMNYARYADQTIITGDVLDYLSNGCMELVTKHLFRVDTDVMACLGNHDSTRVMQGTVPDPTSVESRREILENFWIHDIEYESRVLKDKVMCIALDDGSSRFWDKQVELLKEDIRKARENDYIILLFYHIPLSTLNPADTAVAPIAKDQTDTENLATGGIKPGSPGATTELYNLITSSADVIKGAFCGHWHNDYYSEILATYPDENGNPVDTVIPQYILTATVYENAGHVINITVE